MRGSYYNENDPYAAQWLRNLIAAGHIVAGDVDERSITDVDPADLAGYSQCHFFAGIGVWSHALRLAGWPDDKPIWTGSAPCQPFSAAGKQKGFDDSRHLWPEFYRLIAARNPELVVGEQVPAAVRLGWLDAVFGDLERAGYASGAIVLGAHSVSAPHIRQRLYWMAHTGRERGQRRARAEGPAGEDALDRLQGAGDDQRSGAIDRMGHAIQQGLERHARHGDDSAGWAQPVGSTATASRACGLADTCGSRLPEQRRQRDESPRPAAHGVSCGMANPDSNRCDQAGIGVATARNDGPVGDGAARRPGPTNGFWRDADWLFCRDGRWRPIEPGACALVDGSAARLGRMCPDWRAPSGKAFGNRKGRLKGYGNAIVAPLAAEFIRSVRELIG